MKRRKANIFDLEDGLISPGRWKRFYDKMPKECRDVMDYPPPEPHGIGHHPKLGWYILCTAGQGPMLEWSEHKEE